MAKSRRPQKRQLRVIKTAEPLQCGVCTACCYTHGIAALGKPPFTKCPNLGLVTINGREQEGCTIYEDRPEECRRFACTWLQGKMGRTAYMRPNNFGIVCNGANDEEVGKGVAQVWEAKPGAINRPDTLKWFCEQTHAAESGRIQPVVLQRVVGKLIYGTPELIARLNARGGEENAKDEHSATVGAGNRVRERNEPKRAETRRESARSAGGAVNG